MAKGRSVNVHGVSDDCIGIVTFGRLARRRVSWLRDCMRAGSPRVEMGGVDKAWEGGGESNRADGFGQAHDGGSVMSC